MPVIEVEGLRKSYGTLPAVSDVSLDVDEGEIFGILGPNGAGKTTTVECLQGLRRRDAGRVRVLGLDPGVQADALRRLIGSQLQDSALPDRLRVAEALTLFASFADRPDDVARLLQEWGLEWKRGAAFGSLSGGQRQRLFIALALVNRPRLVFLDELTTGLDPAARRMAWELVRRVRAGGATVVLVTHFMDEAQALCDRLAIIDRGRVVAAGSPATLIAEHGGEGTVRFQAPADEPSFDPAALGELPGVAEVSVDGTRVSVRGRGAILQHVAAELLRRGIETPDLELSRPGLEDVFLALTGDEMRS